MSFEQGVTLAALVLGPGGVWLGWWLNERSATRRSAHDRAMAQDGRNQARIETAYLRILELVEKMGMFCAGVRPLLDTDPKSPDPPLPDLEYQADVRAQVYAFGSAKVRAEYEAWSAIVSQVFAAVRMIDFERIERTEGVSSRGPGEESPHKTLHRLRDEERAARQELGAAIRDELRGE